jgi:hypothetical protein
VACNTNSCVGRRAEAAVLAEREDARAPLPPLRDGDRLVFGAVVDDDDLGAVQMLADRREERRKLVRRVPRDDDEGVCR